MSIPIATWGVNPDIARGVRTCIAPAYDVVHTCTSPSAALTELPALFSGDKSVRPSNGIGSNASLADDQDNVLPKVMAFGGRISPELKEQLGKAMKEKAGDASWADEIKYVEVDLDMLLELTGGGPPTPELVAEYLVKGLKEAGFGN